MPYFAPGIKSKKNMGNLSQLPTDTILTLVRQRHAARRAGLHEDLRIGTPSGMYSFAVPKFLPEEVGQYRLAIPQPVHNWSYNDFEGKLPPGYGEGDVSRIEKSPVILLKNSPSYIEFTRGTSRDSDVYRMVRTKGGNWLLSIKEPGQPDGIKGYAKEHFKSVPMDKVPAMIDQGAEVTEKIDGAGVLAYLGKHGVNVYGIRPDKTGLKPDYTGHIGGLSQIQVPEDLQGQVLRGELYGVRNGRVVPANELSGYLNSNLVNAVDKRRKGLGLMVAALAVHRQHLDDYGAPMQDIVRRLHSPSFTAVPRVAGNKAKRLVRSILAGKDPLTQEGAIIHMPGKRPIKAKVRPDYDVTVQDVFPAETKGEPRAGGFTYSLPGSDKVVGRVGAGFDHQMLRDMLANPAAYRGRTARIQAQEQYPTGAYRAPSFIAMKED